jgi:hypothetical protein
MESFGTSRVRMETVMNKANITPWINTKQPLTGDHQ